MAAGLLLQAPAHAISPPVNDCAGCVASATFSPSSDTGSVVVCPNGARVRLVLTVMYSDGVCVRDNGECIGKGLCGFTTSLSYSTRGGDIDLKTFGGQTDLGTFPNTSGVLTQVTGQQNIPYNLECGFRVRLDYTAISQACTGATPVNIEVDMSCSDCHII